MSNEDIQQTIIDRHEDDDWQLAYWCSDAHGLPVNGGDAGPEWAAAPDTIQEVEGELSICPKSGEVGLHATTQPHKWAGDRVWLVALKRPVVQCKDKLAAKVRHILTDIRPHQVIDASVAARLEMSDLWDADLRGADLRRADLRGATLRGADLRRADLRGADLRGATLRRADLRGATLRRADLRGATLRRATLWGADLRHVRGDLSDANTDEEEA